MAIPDFQSVMLPLVKVLGDGQERTMREVTDLLAESFHLTDQEREELLPSGQQSLFNNRVGWAKSHLKAAGLLENPVRGRVRISDLGRSVLAERPPAINVKFLKRFPAYCDFIGKSAPTHEQGVSDEAAAVEERRTPLELIDAAYKSLRQATAEDLLSKLKDCSPAFFESVVVRLLMAMGYGGVAGQGTVKGKSGDGGIDGVIKRGVERLLRRERDLTLGIGCGEGSSPRTQKRRQAFHQSRSIHKFETIRDEGLYKRLFNYSWCEIRSRCHDTFARFLLPLAGWRPSAERVPGSKL